MSVSALGSGGLVSTFAGKLHSRFLNQHILSDRRKTFVLLWIEVYPRNLDSSHCDIPGMIDVPPLSCNDKQATHRKKYKKWNNTFRNRIPRFVSRCQWQHDSDSDKFRGQGHAKDLKCKLNTLQDGKKQWHRVLCKVAHSFGPKLGTFLGVFGLK